MSILFCTACGYRLSAGSTFCVECGEVFGNEVGLGSDEIPKASNQPSSPAWMTWLDVGGKTLGLGAPLVAVFDFLSPRVALLPFAATIAIVGLVTALVLRRFVVPSLPAASNLRKFLAAEAGLHKSPLLIGTGVLSVLMVTGAAWSNANAPAGGVMASHFDAAKNAQMQLGVLQGLQKVQQVQTAVLEDIREGRSMDPRKELSNIGVTWNSENFRNALTNSDLRVIQLFLDGGIGTDKATLVTAMFSATPAAQTLFVQSGGLARTDACEQALTASRSQLLQNPGELAWAVWRKVCADAESKKRAKVVLSEMALEATNSYDSALSAFKQAEKKHAESQKKPFLSVAACVAHELRDNANHLITEFSRSDASGGFKKSTTVGAREMFLLSLWKELKAVELIREQTGREPPAGFIADELRPKVERFCQDVLSEPPAFTLKPPRRDAIDQYLTVMTRLGVN